MSLPAFRYHPNPIATGIIKPSDATCLCCDQSRGYIYTSHAYCEDELEEALCPWCIADGSAHSKFDAEFTDSAGIGGYSPRVPVPQSVIEEVAFRTPGFSGWQQEQWPACCNDAAAFLGCAGRAELERQWPDAIEAVRAETGLSGEEWQQYFGALHIEHGPTAYVFRCLHCARFLAYSDIH
jgi:uncharacterized protein CbrC (UPF0167 family)